MHLADDYEEQVQTMVKNLGRLVQPILMVILGGFVGSSAWPSSWPMPRCS